MNASWPFGAAALLAIGSASGPVARLDDLVPALTACFRAPPRSAGSSVTIRFSLNRDGAVLGKPAVTFAHLVGDSDDRRAFVLAALGAIAACTPVAVTSGLGGAIAGRPLSIRFIGGGSHDGGRTV